MFGFGVGVGDSWVGFVWIGSGLIGVGVVCVVNVSVDNGGVVGLGELSRRWRWILLLLFNVLRGGGVSVCAVRSDGGGVGEAVGCKVKYFLTFTYLCSSVGLR